MTEEVVIAGRTPAAGARTIMIQTEQVAIAEPGVSVIAPEFALQQYLSVRGAEFGASATVLVAAQPPASPVEIFGWWV